MIYKYFPRQGGIEEMVRKIGCFLRDSGDSIMILTDYEYYKEKSNGKSKEGFKIYHFNFLNLMKLLFYNKIDYIIVFDPFPRYIFLTVLFKTIKRNIISTIIFSGSRSEGVSKMKYLLKLIFLFFDNFIAISDYTKKKMMDTKIRAKIKVIPPPLDVNKYKISKLSGKTIITLDRICSRKRHLELIEVFKKVHDKDKRVRLKIIGWFEEVNRPYYNKIKKLINDYGLNHYVTFCGDVSEREKIKLLSEASLYIKTSRHEMFGISTLEAIASGLPVVAFKNTATAELVGKGGGILIEDGDINKMAKTILKLMNNKNKIKLLSKKAIETAKSFSLDESCNKYKLCIKQDRY